MHTDLTPKMPAHEGGQSVLLNVSSRASTCAAHFCRRGCTAAEQGKGKAVWQTGSWQGAQCLQAVDVATTTAKCAHKERQQAAPCCAFSRQNTAAVTWGVKDPGPRHCAGESSPRCKTSAEPRVPQPTPGRIESRRSSPAACWYCREAWARAAAQGSAALARRKGRERRGRSHTRSAVGMTAEGKGTELSPGRRVRWDCTCQSQYATQRTRVPGMKASGPSA